MSSAATPLLSVSPSRALVDEKFDVSVKNLTPGCPVTVHSLHLSEDKDAWEAYGHYVSDGRGQVSVPEDVSFGGTYTGREAMGLLWSMRPVPGSRKGLRLRKRNICSPLLVKISVYSGHVEEGFGERAPLAWSLTERWYTSPGTRRIEISEKVHGTLFLPPGPGPFPGVLDMWGGGGGLVEYRSALLAAHGYVSLALDYVNSDRTGDIDFTYFETAFNIIKDHPQVMPDRVGIFGLSLGVTLTIWLATQSTIVKPRCCVCVSGSHFYPRGASLYSYNQALLSNFQKLRWDENNAQIWRDLILPVPTDPLMKADVGKIKCPVLLVNGHDDQNWPTVEYAEDMAQMMRAAGNEHLLTKLEYSGAGHLIEPPYTPHFRATNFLKGEAKEKVMLLWGGQTKPHSDAQEDSWTKILSFLQQHLYSNHTPKARM